MTIAHVNIFLPDEVHSRIVLMQKLHSGATNAAIKQKCVIVLPSILQHTHAFILAAQAERHNKRKVGHLKVRLYMFKWVGALFVNLFDLFCLT